MPPPEPAKKESLEAGPTSKKTKLAVVVVPVSCGAPDLGAPVVASATLTEVDQLVFAELTGIVPARAEPALLQQAAVQQRPCPRVPWRSLQLRSLRGQPS